MCAPYIFTLSSFIETCCKLTFSSALEILVFVGEENLRLFLNSISGWVVIVAYDFLLTLKSNFDIVICTKSVVDTNRFFARFYPVTTWNMKCLTHWGVKFVSLARVCWFRLKTFDFYWRWRWYRRLGFLWSLMDRLSVSLPWPCPRYYSPSSDIHNERS